MRWEVRGDEVGDGGRTGENNGEAVVQVPPPQVLSQSLLTLGQRCGCRYGGITGRAYDMGSRMISFVLISNTILFLKLFPSHQYRPRSAGERCTYYGIWS